MPTIIEPDYQDHEAIEAEYGRLPDDATIGQMAERYRYAQVRKMIRLWEHGKLPVELMRELDEIRNRKA
jgi:hypothetical protein